MEQVDAVLKEVFVLLNREVDLYRYSPGFPEFTFAILQRLRKVSIYICSCIYWALQSHHLFVQMKLMHISFFMPINDI